MKGFVLFILVFLLWGCDALEKFDGVVVNKDTRDPVANVAIIRAQNPESYTSITDSAGTFHISFIVRYPTIEKFIFYKEGYLSYEQKLHTGYMRIDTVYLEKTPL